MTSPSMSLSGIETTLMLLFEQEFDELPDDLRADFERDLMEAIRIAPEKRERVAAKLFDLGQRAAVKRAAAKTYLDKAAALNAGADRCEAEAKRLTDYVLAVMAMLPKPKKGARVLEGTSTTFKAKGVADSIDIYDESLLPDQFKTATVTMPLWVYRAFNALYMLKPESGYPGMEPVLHSLLDIPPRWGRVDSATIKEEAQKRIPCPQCSTMENRGQAPGGECPRCKDEETIPATIPGVRLVTGKLRLEVS